MAAGETTVSRPVFFIGMPRSGTSIMFAAFAAHRDLAWFNQYMDRFPAVPGLALMGRATSLYPSTRKAVHRHGFSRSLVDRLRIAPSEAYNVWSRCCGEKFALSYLLDQQATDAEARCVTGRVRRTMRLQGKPRFAAKLTGPGRIGYLSSVFPDARFVNLIRDPRAVVDSLMRVPFWRDTFRYREPAWTGGLTDDDLKGWREDGSPEALAALQWRTVVRTTRREAARLPAGRYSEVRYEDFIAEPHLTLAELFAASDLSDDPDAHTFVDERLGLRDLGQAWRSRLSDHRVEAIERLTTPEFGDLGYRASDPD